MTLGIRVVIFLIGILLFLTILELVRKRKFREELSIIWLLVGFGLMFGAFADMIIDPLARRLKVGYPPALLIILVFFMLIVGLLYFSLVVSDLKGKLKELSQKVALMEYKLNREKQTKNE